MFKFTSNEGYAGWGKNVPSICLTNYIVDGDRNVMSLVDESQFVLALCSVFNMFCFFSWSLTLTNGPRLNRLRYIFCIAQSTQQLIVRDYSVATPLQPA